VARYTDEEAERLIAEHIDAPPGADPAEVRLRNSGISVWALINMFLLSPGEHAAEEVADAYRIEPATMWAAIEYYKRHQRDIDARLAKLHAA